MKYVCWEGLCIKVSDEMIGDAINQDLLPIEECGTGAFLDENGELCYESCVDDVD